MLRAKAAGCVLVITVDRIAGQRDRDVRNGLTIPPQFRFSNAVDFALHPVGMALSAALKSRSPTSPAPARRYVHHSGFVNSQFDQSVTWKDIDWVRSVWDGPGAERNTEPGRRKPPPTGVNAVIVSNHGGRQLDGVPSAIAALPDVVDAVEGRIEVIGGAQGQ
jgi:L-lactate dehydrogenase (cytochrome)